MIDPEILQWLRSQFTFEVIHTDDGKLLIIFIDFINDVVIDCEVSTATSEKQLKYDMNQFMLSLQKMI